jgi:hypothetical protein
MMQKMVSKPETNNKPPTNVRNTKTTKALKSRTKPYKYTPSS